MLNNISEKDLRKIHKMKVINFPGGISEKITDQLDDLLKGWPDDVIVHIGTNDFANKVNLLNNMKKNFRKVSKDSPSTQLAFSSIILRKDENNFEKSRSSRPEVFLGKGVLKICSKFTGEQEKTHAEV